MRQRQQQQQQPNTSSGPGGDVSSPNVPSNMSGPGPNMSGSSGNMSSNNGSNIAQSGNLPPHPAGMASMSQNQHISASGMGPSNVGISNPNAGNNIGPQRLPQNANTASSNLIQSQNMGLSMNIAQNIGPHMGGPQGPNMMGQSIPNNGSTIPNMGQGVGGGGGGGGMNSMVPNPNAMNPSGMGAIMPNNMGPAGSVNMRHEQAKFLQQQQMMRAQAMQQQQQQQQHMVGNRPPPPEYKASQAQMMQAQMMQQQSARFPNASAAAMRRISQQPIPPTSKCECSMFSRVQL